MGLVLSALDPRYILLDGHHTKAFSVHQCFSISSSPLESLYPSKYGAGPRPDSKPAFRPRSGAKPGAAAKPDFAANKSWKRR